MYLLDTDTLSNLGKKRPSSVLLARLATEAGKLYTSSITVGEMIHGAYKSDRPQYYLDRMRLAFGSLSEILPYDEAAAHHFGRQLAELERQGTPPAPLDLQIASIALANDLVLVTHNTDHFKRVKGLKVEDWL